MKFQEAILTNLNIDKRIIRLCRGDIDIPYISSSYNQVTDYWYSHPPALIPLFIREGASYYGLLKHWFTNRKPTYIKYDLEWKYMLEYARNPDQLITLMILNMDMVAEEITEEILKFAQEIGYPNPQDIDDFAEEYGDNPLHIEKLKFLKDDTPLIYVNNLNDYTGEYPSSERLFNAKALPNSCSYEIADVNYISGLENTPEWLNPHSNKKELFGSYINENELGKAWLTLNSTGWKLNDVAVALRQLVDLSNDATFHLVAKNWIGGWEKSTFSDGQY
mgnify:CR=1 FL=1